MFKLYINSIEMDAANAIQLLNSDTQQDHQYLRCLQVPNPGIGQSANQEDHEGE